MNLSLLHILLNSKGLTKVIKQQVLSVYMVDNPFFFLVEGISRSGWISNYTLLRPFGDSPEPLGDGRCQKRQHMVLQSVFKKLRKG